MLDLPMTIKIRTFPSRPQAMMAGPTIPYATLKTGLISPGIVLAEVSSGKPRIDLFTFKSCTE